jgi:hypothetical protein
MGSATQSVQTRSIRFRIVIGRNVVEPGLLRIRLVKSRTVVHDVRVTREEVRWRGKSAASQGGATQSIDLEVLSRLSDCREFFATVVYAGGSPVVSGIVRIDPVDAPVMHPEDDPASRIRRRRDAAGDIEDPTAREQYLWFTRLEERSDEDALTAHPQELPKLDVRGTITQMRAGLKSVLEGRIVSARTDVDAEVCTPTVVDALGNEILLIREQIFDGDLILPGALQKLGANGTPGAFDAFLAFCQGDLRVTDDLSDVNVEPDSAMVFLFAEFALALLQVVDRVASRAGQAPSPNPNPNPITKRLEVLALQIAADPVELAVWKRLVAAFVLGQRAFMRAYAPRGVLGPAEFDDFTRTNFDRTERLTDDDLKELRAPYDALEFTPGLPSFSDPVLRQLAWRHALNACEAFPGMLERDRMGNLGALAIPHSSQPPPTAAVLLRTSRGSSTTIRRHVRREIASIAPVAKGIGTGKTMQDLGIDLDRRLQLQVMLAAYCTSRARRLVEVAQIPIDADTTVDDLVLRVDDLVN